MNLTVLFLTPTGSEVTMAARVRKPAEGRMGPCGSEDTESRDPTIESGVSRSPGESHALHTGVLMHTAGTDPFHFAEW